MATSLGLSDNEPIRPRLDLRADDLDSEVTRLTALGATVLSDQPNVDLVVMRDPEGNEFCVLAP